ncbi:MAG: MFS transporter [Chloroflexi bacterium]|nr:MFS transporter [Chloroflexota bacterium]
MAVVPVRSLPEPAAPARASDRHRRTLFLLVVAASLLSGATHTSYAPSLAAVRGEFETTFTLVGATLGAYGLALAAAQLGYGALADLFSARRLLISGLGLYVVACVAAFVAPTIWLFIAIRIFQAIGIAGATVIGAAIIVDLFPPRERGKGLGALQTFSAIGGAIGFLFGSLVIIFATWRSTFAILAAMGTLILVGVVRFVPRHGLRPPSFVWREARALFCQPAVLATTMGCFAQMFGVFTFHSFTATIYREKIPIDQLVIGLIFVLFSVGVSIGASFGGRLADRLGRRRCCLIGLAGSTVTIACYTVILTQAVYLWEVPIMVALYVTHAGFLGFSTPAQIALSVEWFPNIRGTVVGLVTASRFAGSAIGPIVAGVAVDRVGEMWAGFAAGSVVVAVGLALGYLLIIEAPRAAPFSERE